MNKKLLVVSAIILVAATARLLPHAPNFTPIGAIALFAGAYISNRVLAFILPLIAMIFSDALLGFSGWNYPEQTIAVYASFVLITWMGMNMRENKSVLRIGVSSLGASILFFVLTNFIVWVSGFSTPTPLYTTDFAGLLTCYTMAIPFFGYTIGADLFYSMVLFGGYYLLQVNVPQLKESI
ncbi:MAG: hypothetical protein H3C45_04140 [Bacteroidia bacterium]|nr:hypothetical protein [Bacteroidia bacterium]MCZ2141012.1 hypothetical protein [Bacteroidia bacterium]